MCWQRRHAIGEGAPPLCACCSDDDVNGMCVCVCVCVQVGYWSSAGNPLEFYLCSSPGRCPGGLQPGTCPAGYDDVLCADCQSGWYTSGPICKECRSSIWQVTLTAAFFLLIAVPCLIIFIVSPYACPRRPRTVRRWA